MAGKPLVLYQSLGRGHVVAFADDPNYRAMTPTSAAVLSQRGLFRAGALIEVTSFLVLALYLLTRTFYTCFHESGCLWGQFLFAPLVGLGLIRLRFLDPT